MRHLSTLFLPSIVLTLIASSAHAAEVQVLTTSDPKLVMAPITLPNGKTVNYSVGPGSGAFRHPSDPVDVIWTVGIAAQT